MVLVEVIAPILVLDDAPIFLFIPVLGEGQDTKAYEVYPFACVRSVENILWTCAIYHFIPVAVA